LSSLMFIKNHLDCVSRIPEMFLLPLGLAYLFAIGNIYIMLTVHSLFNIFKLRKNLGPILS